MGKQILKQLLIAAATVLVPFVYSALTNIAPGISIGGDQFLQFVIWLISGIIGGGAIAMASDTFVRSRPDFMLTSFNKTWTFAVPVVIYASIIIAAVRFIL